MGKAYAYFYNGVWPIRAIYDEQGRLEGTETPNPETGEIELNMYWISKVREDRSGDIEEITAEEFERHCERIYVQSQEESI
jgi:hypothetical protein